MGACTRAWTRVRSRTKEIIMPQDRSAAEQWRARYKDHIIEGRLSDRFGNDIGPDPNYKKPQAAVDKKSKDLERSDRISGYGASDLEKLQARAKVAPLDALDKARLARLKKAAAADADSIMSTKPGDTINSKARSR